MANITLLHYNNYFNRIVKKLDTVAEYKEADTTTEGQVQIPHYLDISNTNFVPGDGIYTTHVFGTSAMTMDFDYLLVTHTNTTVTPSVEVIDSRWFILEKNRTRDGQFELSLKRDIIVDNYDAVLNSTAYVEKGYVSSENPLIFNKEGLDVNQIKKEEILLRDATKSPWIVAYIAKGASMNTRTVNYSPQNQDYTDIGTTLTNWQFGQYLGKTVNSSLTDIYYKIRFQLGTGNNWHYGHKTAIISQEGGIDTVDTKNDSWNYALRTNTSKDQGVANSIATVMKNVGLYVYQNHLNSLLNIISDDQFALLKSYNNKVVKTGTEAKYYKIHVESTGIVQKNDVSITSGTSLFTSLSSAVVASNAFDSSHRTPDNESFVYSCQYQTYRVWAEEQDSYQVEVKIQSTHRATVDALYDIICMPYDNVAISDGSNTFYTTKELSVATMSAIATGLGGGGANSRIYDVQLLPYCPVQNLVAGSGLVRLTGTEGIAYDYIMDTSTDPDSKIGVIIYVSESNFTFDISCSLDWSRSKYVSGFNPIPQDGETINNWLKPGVDYAITDIHGIDDYPPDEPGPHTNWYQAMTTFIRVTAFSARSVDGLQIKYVDKQTGTVIDEYIASTIGYYRTGNEANNYIVIRSSAGQQAKWMISEWNNLSFYVVFNCIEGFYSDSGSGSIGSYDDNPIYGPGVFYLLSSIPKYAYANSESVDMKLANECNTYRLVSPNYQGNFEFSVAKNRGVSLFNIDCTYRPYNPYIHINPNFKSMYGRDFNDSRGLVCQGDFSFGMLSDAFTNYELNNKNYQNIFNRQITNMDVNNAINRQEAKWQAAAGVVQGTASGAITGGVTTGSPWGAAAGAVIGGGTALAGGIMDLQNLSKRQEEARQFAIDNFDYSLQNIKALPYSLTSCSALTYNNKLFPFLELYTCTTEEKQLVFNKLRYDGMTVNAIDTLKNYKHPSERWMLRGEIIRFSNTELQSDAHMANEIWNEIKKGVYI